MFNDYLDLLANNTEITEADKETCCEKQDLIKIDHTNVCINCGIVNETDYLKDDETDMTTINPLRKAYSRNTYMRPIAGAKFAALKRLDTWSNYHYKEDKIVKSYDSIEEIYNHLNIHTKGLIQKSKLLYNDIYIGDGIQSRRKIKQSLLIYSVITVLKNEDIDCNIFDILKHYEISIQQYNDGVAKISEDLLHEDIEFIHENLNEYLTITIEDVIEKYNNILKQKDNFKKKCNDRTILIGSIYELIKDKLNKKTFCSKFKITNASLNKILRNLK